MGRRRISFKNILGDICLYVGVIFFAVCCSAIWESKMDFGYKLTAYASMFMFLGVSSLALYAANHDKNEK